jgi:hypothetical protein
VESGGNFEDYIRVSCHLLGPVTHGQNWKGWERSGEKGLIISDNQAQTCLIITINDTSIGDLPLIITISDTCKNQPKRLDLDNTINLSNLIVNLVVYVQRCFIQNNRDSYKEETKILPPHPHKRNILNYFSYSKHQYFRSDLDIP